jgi:hypothetical protein
MEILKKATPSRKKMPDQVEKAYEGVQREKAKSIAHGQSELVKKLFKSYCQL